MLRIHARHDAETGGQIISFHEDRVDEPVAEIRLAPDATFEDFAVDVERTVTARSLVRGIAGRASGD